MVWFPHDNHPDLLKELAWESGNPRWVLHGTPASGAGVMGLMEMGTSVVACCEDPHHEKNPDSTEAEGRGSIVGRVAHFQRR